MIMVQGTSNGPQNNIGNCLGPVLSLYHKLLHRASFHLTIQGIIWGSVIGLFMGDTFHVPCSFPFDSPTFGVIPLNPTPRIM